MPESELAVHYPNYEGMLAALEHQGKQTLTEFFFWDLPLRYNGYK
jgi:hypothetical protein